MRRSKFGLVAAVLVVALTACSGSGDGANEAAEPAAAKVDDLAALVPEDIAAKGTINLGVNVDIAPLKFIDDMGEVTGFSVEQFKLASAVLGLDVNIEQGSFDSLIPGLDSGRYDALASLADTAERQESVRFVDFLRAGVSWVAKPSENITLASRDDLCGHSVAVLKGSGAEGEMQEQLQSCAAANAPELRLASYADSNAALLAVDSGEDQLAMIDSPAAAYNAGAFPDKYTVAFTEYTNPNGIGFPMQPEGLADAYSAALKHLYEDGKYQTLAAEFEIPEGDLITDFPINAGPQLKG